MALNTNQTTDTVTPSTGSMRVNGTLLTGAAPGAEVITTSNIFSYVPNSYVLSDDIGTDSTTFSAITGWDAFAVAASERFVIDFIGIVSVDNANAAPVFAIEIPSGTVYGAQWAGSGAVDEPYLVEQVASNAVRDATVASLRATNQDLPIIGKWVVEIGGTGGAMTFNFRVKSAAGAGTATIKAGSVLTFYSRFV